MGALGGDESETDAARRLIEKRPTIRETDHEICDQIDQRYYSVSIDGDRAIAKTLWGTTQWGTRMSLYTVAVMKLQKHRVATLRNNVSEIIAQGGWQQYVRDAAAWAQWRPSWIYNTPVKVQLKNSMATPDQIRRVRQESSQVPPQPDRPGEISGDEERVNERNGVIPEDEDNAISTDEDEERRGDVHACSGIL